MCSSTIKRRMKPSTLVRTINIMNKAIRNIKYIIFVVSLHSVNSAFSIEEVKSAFGITLGSQMHSAKETLLIKSEIRNQPFQTYSSKGGEIIDNTYVHFSSDEGDGNEFYPNEYPKFFNKFKYYVDDEKIVYKITASGLFQNTEYGRSECKQTKDTLYEWLKEKYDNDAICLDSSDCSFYKPDKKIYLGRGVSIRGCSNYGLGLYSIMNQIEAIEAIGRFEKPLTLPKKPLTLSITYYDKRKYSTYSIKMINDAKNKHKLEKKQAEEKFRTSLDDYDM